MKRFAIFQTGTEQSQIVEGLSATITRKGDSLNVVINQSNKSRQVFKNVIIFTEVSDKIKMI